MFTNVHILNVIKKKGANILNLQKILNYNSSGIYKRARLLL